MNWIIIGLLVGIIIGLLYGIYINHQIMDKQTFLIKVYYEVLKKHNLLKEIYGDTIDIEELDKKMNELLNK